MAQYLGILTNDPSLLRCQLHRLRECIPFDENESLGLGSFDDPNILLAKRPAKVGPRDLALLAEGIQSSALIAVGRGDATYAEETIDPFRFRRWLFAMNGAVDGFPDLRESLEASLPVFIARSLRSTTDREAVFALFLRTLHEQGLLDDPHLGGQEAARSLAKTVRALDELCRSHGHARPSELVMIATNGRVLAAVRRGRPLSYLLAEGEGVCDLCGIDETSPGDDPKVRPHRRARSVAIAGHPRPKSGFIEVPEGSTMGVGRSLEINVSSL